jgi:hypothetical protein
MFEVWPFAFAKQINETDNSKINRALSLDFFLHIFTCLGGPRLLVHCFRSTEAD